ncbi:hypothetical protein CFC21_038209 [Triticum aestivum]|uniref:Uncharacterized protein n=3 Tax=Triticum TaxID=4564 RepID=A0A9R0RZV1_TRITD|nr:hypothetical protein CFC21_038209 [Triticum aestivum]VAH69391.1 unnamed protein product [Triticum turgidum subsp. durum]
MALTRLFISLFPVAVLAGLASASASPFLPDSAFQGSTGSTGRSLLQAKNDTMFTYIDFRGYPKGMFADECLKGKEGVSCEGIPAVDTGVPSGGRQVQGISRPLVVLLCGLGALLFP